MLVLSLARDLRDESDVMRMRGLHQLPNDEKAKEDHTLERWREKKEHTTPLAARGCRPTDLEKGRTTEKRLLLLLPTTANEPTVLQRPLYNVNWTEEQQQQGGLYWGCYTRRFVLASIIKIFFPPNVLKNAFSIVAWGESYQINSCNLNNY